MLGTRGRSHFEDLDGHLAFVEEKGSLKVGKVEARVKVKRESGRESESYSDSQSFNGNGGTFWETGEYILEARAGR